MATFGSVNKSAVKEKKLARIWGASLFGKYVTIFLHPELIEVRSVSTFMLIAGMWFCILLLGIPAFLFTDLIITFVVLLIGGVGGYLLMTRVYRGKRLYELEFANIASFVCERADFTINMRDNQLITLRMMPKKQKILLNAISEAMAVQQVYELKKMGLYFKVHQIGDAPVEPMA